MKIATKLSQKPRPFCRYVAELTEEFEQKLGEDRHLRIHLHEEKTELDREFTETKHQVEDDIDTEIDNLRWVPCVAYNLIQRLCLRSTNI